MKVLFNKKAVDAFGKEIPAWVYGEISISGAVNSTKGKIIKVVDWTGVVYEILISQFKTWKADSTLVVIPEWDSTTTSKKEERKIQEFKIPRQ